MKIKVKQKPEDYQQIVPGIIATILFFSFGGGMMFFSLLPWFKSPTLDNFMIVFSANGIMTLFGLAFFLLSLYFIKFLISPPKRFIAVLKSIKEVPINGITIYNYVFKVETSKSLFAEYNCYTEENYNFVVGNKYGLYVKEFNWAVKAVSEIDQNIVEKEGKPQNELQGLIIVIYVFFLIFGGGILFLIIKIIYDLCIGEAIGPDIIGIGGCAVFFVPALLLYFSALYSGKSLDEKIEFDKKRLMKKIKQVNDTKNLISNTQYNGNYDLDLSNINSFKVSRFPFNGQDNYEAIDEHYETKLYKIVNENNKYFIKDSVDCITGEIKLKVNDDGVELIIIPIKGDAFALYYKKFDNYGYKILGRNYDINKTKNIVNLTDKNGLDIGYININENGSFPSGEVIIKNITNNEDIIFICLGVMMIEYHNKKKK